MRTYRQGVYEVRVRERVDAEFATIQSLHVRRWAEGFDPGPTQWEPITMVALIETTYLVRADGRVEEMYFGGTGEGLTPLQAAVDHAVTESSFAH